jgi:hypothetical protein
MQAIPIVNGTIFQYAYFNNENIPNIQGITSTDGWPNYNKKMVQLVVIGIPVQDFYNFSQYPWTEGYRIY